ncbi:MAG: ANTAR domain-containing protein [Clostridia bacterium]|nr:ANTAR domain-containing protein [Clostridia bacterium]
MESARILLAMSNDASISKLRVILVENGYTVVDQAKDGNECLRKIRALKPDLVILDYGLPLMNGFEVSKVVIEDKVCDIILIISPAQEGLISNIKSENNFVCMSKPLNKPSLINTIDLMVKNKRRIRELEQEIETLKASLDTRKEVEKAKGLLMKHLSLSEAEAFKRIQRQSMDRGIPMKEIAKAIILAYDI